MRPGLVQREEWEWTRSLKSLAMKHLHPSLAPCKKELCLLDAPQRGGSPASAVGQSRQHLCVLVRGSAVNPGKSGRSVGWGREEWGDKGSDFEEKVMSLVAHCRLRARKLLSPVSPFCVRQRHRASWECSKGWEQAACMSSEDGHTHVLLDKAHFPSCFRHTNVTHASVSISFPRISSAVAPAMANNRTKPKSGPLFSNDLHTGDTAWQIQRSKTACSVSVCLSSMAHAILFAQVSLPASWERWEGCLLRAILNFPETTK